MKLEEYNKIQHSENSKQIAIDFDGVIHGNSKGFHDGTVYDEPIVGSLDAVKHFYNQGYSIIVFTAKAKPDRPLVNGKTGAQLVWDWLGNYNFSSYINKVTAEKPRALVYIDDKGLRFNNWEETLKQVDELTNTGT
jgi:hypothetical protein